MKNYRKGSSERKMTDKETEKHNAKHQDHPHKNKSIFFGRTSIELSVIDFLITRTPQRNISSQSILGNVAKTTGKKPKNTIGKNINTNRCKIIRPKKSNKRKSIRQKITMQNKNKDENHNSCIRNPPVTNSTMTNKRTSHLQAVRKNRARNCRQSSNKITR